MRCEWTTAGMEARPMSGTQAACKTGQLRCRRSMWRPRGVTVKHPAPPSPLYSTRSQNRKRFGLRRWRWAAWCRTRSACPGSAAQSVPSGCACVPHCPRGASPAAGRETVLVVGIRDELRLQPHYYLLVWTWNQLCHRYSWRQHCLSFKFGNAAGCILVWNLWGFGVLVWTSTNMIYVF